MKTLKTAVILSLLLLTIFPSDLLAKGKERGGFPAPTGAVNDFANVIPPEYRNTMARLAQDVLQKTGVAIVVATFPEIGDNSPEDFANRLYQAWGIGRKGEDRGVLIFVAVKERRIRIETGYGVEGILPDGLVGEIRDRYAIPYLKQGDYGRGLSNTVTAIAEVVTRDAGVSMPDGQSSRPVRQAERGPSSWREKLWLGVFLFLILPFLLFTRTGRFLLFAMLLSGGRGGGRGGFGGFGGGGFGGFGGGSSGGGGAGGSY